MAEADGTGRRHADDGDKWQDKRAGAMEGDWCRKVGGHVVDGPQVYFVAEQTVPEEEAIESFILAGNG